MQRKNVLLPEPEAPMMEMTSSRSAVSEMPLSTSSGPKRFMIPSATSAAVAADTVIERQYSPCSAGR